MKNISATVIRMLIIFLFFFDKGYAQSDSATELHRPQIHFSPSAKWMNDPNGMVYHKGVYHLFFQYYPDGTKWGPMHWGHATSKDMVNWKEEPIALYPDSLGYIFSGSAVVDAKNTSGFGENANAPLVAIFTHHNVKLEQQKRDDYQYQSLAYSTDDGSTWKKYAGNPVLKNPGITDFRDPKVMWFEAGNKWIMTLATKDRITFYSSPDLKSWTRESEFGKALGAHGGVWECPDLFPLDLDGHKVWVLIVSINPGGPNAGSATQYFTGQFDGKTFTPADTITRWMDYGTDNYAGVTFSNTGPKKILMGWMNNWQYADRVPTEKWRGAMTLPRELGLKKVNNQVFLTSLPVGELDKLAEQAVTEKNIIIKDSFLLNKNTPVQGVFKLTFRTASPEDFQVVLSNTAGNELVVGYEKQSNRYFIDRTKSGSVNFEKGFAARHYAPRISQQKNIQFTLIADVASVELFADDGLTVMTDVFFPDEHVSAVQIRSSQNLAIPELSFAALKAKPNTNASRDRGFASLTVKQNNNAAAIAQHAEVYPTHWWTGMKWNKVQLLVRGSESLAEETVRISYPGVSIQKVHKLENQNYLAVDLTISPAAKPGTVNIRFVNGQGELTIPWRLLPRRKGNGSTFAQGVRSDDFIYLLMPDRFSNGDPANDRIPGMKDQSLNRDSIFLRHGGDLQGVINHLDYLKELGVTAIWMTPVIENDMPNRTEHGYAFTNHYRIEPRLGGEQAYKKLSDELHARGMKLIQDAVYNHMGLHHFLMQDPPAKNWVHQWPEFTKPNYKDQTHFDPHAAPSDKKVMTDGWFTNEMPDLNQSNPMVANFLIQHALWCVEEFGVDGWRIDTYIYVDLPFMNRCNEALRSEYPRLTMFGESWVDGTANQAYFTRNNYDLAFNSNPTGTIDFQTLFHGIMPALTQPVNGVNQLYQTLSNDFLYQDPMANVIFLDNHDMSRFYSVVGENVKKQKMAIQWLLTGRGIPQMYYGTEVLMKGISNPDGWVRLDFPGGWQGDGKNGFTGDGLSEDERAVQALTRKLANYRKKTPALHSGKLMHYIPQNGVYVYFRYNGTQTIMCIMNTSSESREIDFSKFSERTSGFTSALNILSDATHSLTDKIMIPGEEAWVLELRKAQ